MDKKIRILATFGNCFASSAEFDITDSDEESIYILIDTLCITPGQWEGLKQVVDERLEAVKDWYVR